MVPPFTVPLLSDTDIHTVMEDPPAGATPGASGVPRERGVAGATPGEKPQGSKLLGIVNLVTGNNRRRRGPAMGNEGYLNPPSMHRISRSSSQSVKTKGTGAIMHKTAASKVCATSQQHQACAQAGAAPSAGALVIGSVTSARSCTSCTCSTSCHTVHGVEHVIPLAQGSGEARGCALAMVHHPPPRHSVSHSSITGRSCGDNFCLPTAQRVSQLLHPLHGCLSVHVCLHASLLQLDLQSNTTSHTAGRSSGGRSSC